MEKDLELFYKLEKQIIEECHRRRKEKGIYLGEPELTLEPDLFSDLYKLRAKYQAFKQDKDIEYEDPNPQTVPYSPQKKQSLIDRLNKINNKVIYIKS